MSPTMVVAGIMAALLTLGGVPLVRRLASRWGVVDLPNERSLHTTPMPRGGGLAITGVVLLAFPVLAAFEHPSSWSIVLTYVAGAAVVAGMGLLDDRLSLSPYLRLAVQTTAATLVVYKLGFFADIHFPIWGPIHIGGLGVPLTIIWIVGLCNAYNFMDGIDGLAAGQAVVAGLLWAIIGWLHDLPLVTGLAMLLASSSLGFMPHNWSPARIFMGDVGSAFLGFSFAVLPIMAVAQTGDARYPVVGVLVVGVFVFDTFSAFLWRLWRRDNVLRAHRSHLYQRLIALGYSHRAIAGTFLALGAVVGVGGILQISTREPLTTLAVVTLLGLLAAVGLGVVLLERERWSRVAFPGRRRPVMLSAQVGDPKTGAPKEARGPVLGGASSPGGAGRQQERRLSGAETEALVRAAAARDPSTSGEGLDRPREHI